jgi:DNA repair exonuclease SbcCD nuclease subunit
MKPFRFIHAADLHLDSPFRGLAGLPEGIRERLRESTFHALERMVRLAFEQRADFVVIAGDVYDAADRSLRAQIRFQRAMEQLADYGIPAFVVHGNHDPLDGRMARLRWPETVRFFDSREVGCYPAETGDRGTVAYVYGISYGTSAVTENLAAKFQPDDSPVYKIGLLHANVDGDPLHDNYAPCRIRDLADKRIDYWALGHVHNRQVLHEYPHMVYPGNIQGRHIRETGEKGCYIVDVDAGGATCLTFHSLDSVRWFRRRISIDGLETEQQLKEAVEDELERVREEAGGRASVVRLELHGRGPLHARFQREPLLDELAFEWRAQEARLTEASAAYPFVWIETVDDRTGAEIDKSALMAQQNFLGDLLRMSAELASDSDRFETFAEEALAPMMNHPALRKLLGGMTREERLSWLKAAEELAVDLLAETEENT